MTAVANFDPTTPSIARVYDYLLNGKDNFAADREVAQRLMAVAPLTAEVTRENRAPWSWYAGRGRRPGVASGLGAGRASAAS
jgi:hypothetical protein